MEDNSNATVNSTDGTKNSIIPEITWTCQDCSKKCILVRDESRCLCGHRLKDHSYARKVDNADKTYFCTKSDCHCERFFFIVAQGAWILRCKCKHKHVEHDPVTHQCSKQKCECDAFSSPWVCNCDHPWSRHTQGLVLREARPGQHPGLPFFEIRDNETTKRGCAF